MKFDYDQLKKKKNIFFKDKFYDFIIIGSGPAAVTLYKKLLSIKNIKRKILIIEEGDYLKKSYQNVISRNLKIKLKSRAFTVGGTSSIWANISSYFEDFEMEPRWKNSQLNLWPFKHKFLLEEYRRLDKKYEFSFNKLKKKNFDIPFQVRPFVASVKPKNFKQFINNNDVDLIYNCKVETIDETKKSAIAFTKNHKLKFTAKKIIVCCGGIESVSLIQNSLSQKKLKNLKNKNIVGRYFMDHPKFSLGYLKYPKLDIINQLELTKKNNKIFYFGVSLKKNIQRKYNVLNSYVRFEKSNSKIIRFFEKLNLSIMKNLIKKRSIYRVRLFCEMEPNFNNSITFKKNKTIVKLKLNNTDYKTIKLLSLNIKNFFSLKPKKESNFKFDNINNKIEGASHHMGGLRFDHNKNLSIIDKNLKIIGLKNIYVCGSSIFPTSGSVNPTMTICALSNRLGDHLKKDY